MNDLTLNPPFALAPTLLLIACVIGIVMWSFLSWRRGLGLLLLRVGAILAVGGLLLGPSRFVLRDGDIDKPRVSVLVDRSLSMCLADAGVDELGDPRRRIDALRDGWLSRDALLTLAGKADVRLHIFAEDSQVATLRTMAQLQPDGNATRIAHALRTAIEDMQRAENSGRLSREIVLVSDGADTSRGVAQELSHLAAEARALGVRIHAVVAGSDESAPDAAVRLALDDSILFAGQQTTLRVHVATANLKGETSELIVRELIDDESRIVLRRRVALDTAKDIELKVSPAAPQHIQHQMAITEYTASLGFIEREIDRSNNVARAIAQVSGKHIRVAIFENQPSWDAKHFIATMRADPQVDITAIMGLGRRQRVTRFLSTPLGVEEVRLEEAPIAEDDIFDFDIVVLGRGVERWFGERSDVLRRFVVDRGGSIIFLRGDVASGNDAASRELVRVLRQLSPLVWEESASEPARVSLALTPGGGEFFEHETLGDLGQMFAQLPDHSITARASREKALAFVVASAADGGDGSGEAVIAHQRVGAGATFAVVAEGMWRWAMLPSALAEFDSVYRVFWSRVVRFLALGGDFLPGEKITLAVSPASAAPGENIQIVAQTRSYQEEDAIDAQLMAPDGTKRSILLSRTDKAGSRYIAVIAPQTPGMYTIAVSHENGDVSARTPFVIEEDRDELLDTTARPDLLRLLTDGTGGEMLPLDDPKSLLRLLEVREEAHRLDVEPRLLWPHGSVFGLIVGLLGVEWFCRRRGGMA